VRLLVDTHLLLWAAARTRRLSQRARSLIDDDTNELFFSAVSIWEIAIKSAARRSGFPTDARVLREQLLQHRYTELPVTSEHALEVALLPMIHRDPFDRILVAQARLEQMMLLTSDDTLARYPGPIERV
jgi:PIN domain nuclease of toxin-antitoxin system